MATSVWIRELVKRARLDAVKVRAKELDDLHAMRVGDYVPKNGDFLPEFREGSLRHKAFIRATKTTEPPVPMIVNRSLAGIDFGGITWGDPEKASDKTLVDDLLGSLPLDDIARSLATEYKISGVMAGMASFPLAEGGAEDQGGDPRIEVFDGLNLPYLDAVRGRQVTGWLRGTQYLDDANQNKLMWWVETYEFLPDGRTVHRIWKRLKQPTYLATDPDMEFVSDARPRFSLYGLQPDGFPSSVMIANKGKMLGLYATDLRLATVEEIAAFPLLKLRGLVDLAENEIGPGSPITLSTDGDAEWMEPGNLEELREQLKLKRDQVREVFLLPGGSLGGQTPSGEALQEANRGFMQETGALVLALEGTLDELANDFLAIYGLSRVKVSVPIDRAYLTSTMLETTQAGADLQAVPDTVLARLFQQFLGSVYTDDDLDEHLKRKEESRSMMSSLVPGQLLRGDEPQDDEDDEVS